MSLDNNISNKQNMLSNKRYFQISCHTTTSQRSVMMVILFILIVSMMDIIIVVNGNAPSPQDDDCLGIAMRPLPRFGKRFFNQPEMSANLGKRGCIISRRRSDLEPLSSAIVSSPSRFYNSYDPNLLKRIMEDMLLSSPLSQQQQQSRDQESLERLLYGRYRRDLIKANNADNVGQKENQDGHSI